MEITLVLSIFKEIRDWILGIEKSNLENKKENKIALKSIYVALSETRSYFSDRKILAKDRERERQIAKLWFEAAIELKEIDNDLAMRCFLKGEFWTDPDNWKNDEEQNLNISINEMTSLCRKLLN